MISKLPNRCIDCQKVISKKYEQCYECRTQKDYTE